MDDQHVWTKVVGYTNLLVLSNTPNTNMVNVNIHHYNLPWRTK
jgi:hypothetical protein